MKVTAIRMGYYNLKRRKKGDEFHLLNAEDFSEKWMVKDGAAPVAKTEAAVIIPEDENETEKKGLFGKGKAKKDDVKKEDDVI